MRAGRIVWVVVALTLLPGSARAEGPASIRGTVADTLGQPVEGICVDAYDDLNGFGHFAQSGPDGTYSLDGVEPGSYVVSFYDCREHPTYLTQWFDRKESYDEADRVEVGIAASVPGVDAALELGGFVTGALLDTEGSPATACVAAYDDSFNFVGATSSDETGAYRLGPLPSGPLRIHFADCGYAYARAVAVQGRGSAIATTVSPPVPEQSYVREWYDDAADFDSATPVPVAAGADTPAIDAVLRPGALITGVVRDDAGRGLESMCVEAFDQDSVSGGFAVTYWEGRYAIGQLPPGTYKVGFFDCGSGDYLAEWWNDKTSFSDADAIEVTEGATISGIDAVLAKRPRPDFAVTGLRVSNVPLRTDAGPLPGPGLQRRIDVEVANLGNATSWGLATLSVWTVTKTDGARRNVAHESFSLDPGGKTKRSFDWDAIGQLGDVDVYASLCVPDDPNPTNDAARVRWYAVAGGTGVGFTVREPGYDWGIICYGGPGPTPVPEPRP